MLLVLCVLCSLMLDDQIACIPSAPSCLIPPSTHCMLQAADDIVKLYNDVFLKYDATMLEINPMSEDNQGEGENRNFLSPFQRTTEPW